MQFISNHQLEVMFALESFCFLQIIFALIMKIEQKEKKWSLIAVNLCTMLLLLADRYAYIYRGNTTEVGYYVVRISNFTVFAMNYLVLDAYNSYLISVLKPLGTQKELIKVLKFVRPVVIIGVILIGISQFFGFYYTFDENNRYQRADGFLICYIIPLIIMVFYLFVFEKVKKVMRKSVFFSLFFFSLFPIVAAVLQLFLYGLSLTNIAIGVSTIILFVLAIADQNHLLQESNKREIESLAELNNLAKEQFEQTALALVTAIDAKDEYTHGHSRRVAEYSKRIAQESGLSEDECDKIYFAALLHDVGKIGIRDSILTKEGKLTKEEFDVIKQHPALGNNILKEINSTPYLSIGAHYHHERYDGTGYPEGIKGEDIPNMARIIAVADAYDAMTSSRSYRTPLAQQKVREELVKGLGTQFDPKYAITMVHILDTDTEYRLKEDLHKFDGLHDYYAFNEYKKICTNGIRLSDCITRISFSYKSVFPTKDCVPSIVVYDSLDECVYTDENDRIKMEYTGFIDISVNGDVTCGQIREHKCDIKPYPKYSPDIPSENEVIIETLKQRDHFLVRVFTEKEIREYTIALRDRSQFAFSAITGKKCSIRNLKVKRQEKPAEVGYISRIVEETSYINDEKEGDLRNLEIAGWREDHSDGVLVDGKFSFFFHSMSLPASKRLWHCPIILLFTAENGKVYGPGYRELAQIRLDGEGWEADPISKIETKTFFDDSFISWDEWKKSNRGGVDCAVHIEKKGNKIYVSAEDSGVRIESVTTLSANVPVYCSLTGDQVALTTICLLR